MDFESFKLLFLKEKIGIWKYKSIVSMNIIKTDLASTTRQLSFLFLEFIQSLETNV